MKSLTSFGEGLDALIMDEAVWLLLVVVAVCFYREYYRVQNAEKAFKWLFWDFSGIRFIISKIYPKEAAIKDVGEQMSPSDKGVKEKNLNPPSTFMIWTLGIYAALFGIASNRYENAVDKIENRMSAFITQLADISEDVRKEAFGEIREIQATRCPLKPELMLPSKVMRSFVEEDVYDLAIERLTRAVDKYKDDLKGAQLSSARLDGANLNGGMLEGARLDSASLENANLNGAHMKDCNLYRANLKGANLSGAYLVGVNLFEAQLAHADLSSSHLSHVISWGTDFEGATLFNADLKGAEFYKANFKGAKLIAAHLKGAQLYDTNFEDANLHAVDLEGAILIGVNLEGANLVNAQLRQSRLREVKGLSVNQLCSATSLHQVRMDSELEARVRKKCLEKLEPPIK